MPNDTDLERSTFQDLPAYRYLRQSDNLPVEAPEEAMALVKLFDPTGSWTWYIASYNREDRTCFGLVDGFELEYGYISMAELVEFRGLMGLPLERDIHWTPKPLKEIADA